MENSLAKITWGYIWRVIVWYILISLVLGFIVTIAVSASSLSNITNVSIDLIISMSKKLIVGMIIVNIIGIILSCKFATSGIKKKFNIDSSNVKAVVKNIIIVLVILAVISGIYSIITNTRNIDKQQEELKQAISKLSDETGLKWANDADNFIKFCDTIRIVSIISDIGIIVLMIPFEKMLLKVKENKEIENTEE